jgi:hypothetical protein
MEEGVRSTQLHAPCFAAALLAAAMAVNNGAGAQPDKALYELRERCAKQATEWFEKEWGRSGVVNTADGQILASFENRYNPLLNTCLVLLNSPSVNTKQSPPTVFYSSDLFDLLNNETIGECWQSGAQVMRCHLRDDSFNSRDVWLAAARAVYGAVKGGAICPRKEKRVWGLSIQRWALP